MQILISILFIIGFIAIAFEEVIKINKAASALFIAILSWVILFFNNNHPEHVGMIMGEHLTGIASIVFFLLGAMTIVEIIDGHDGFYEVSKIINTKSKMTFVLMVAILSFFISSILDNLTASIVMVSIVNKLLEDRSQKLYISGLIIIAANAGGVWSPIGDVTTTMLWMGGQIETLAIVKTAFMPSFISMLVAGLLIRFRIKGELIIKSKEAQNEISTLHKKERISVLFLGIFSFMLVPILKATIHIPPFAGMLFALSVMWLITSLMHQKKTNDIKDIFSVQNALQRIDTPSILFFLGILLNISALEFAGILDMMASKMTAYITHPVMITSAIGLVSSIVDNVPLVAATQKMFTLSQYPVNHYFWILLAYTAGTGGSCLIIGSAAGVGVMGVQKISFGWYLRHISWIALVSFFAGMLIFFLQGSL
jgi:Na+/H+ antiporter NhaD/arsenite permease-like protein